MFDFIKTIVQLARTGPPEICQDHQIDRASGPMVHCLEMLISSPDHARKNETMSTLRNVEIITPFLPDHVYITNSVEC